jgi:hypothetical protein
MLHSKIKPLSRFIKQVNMKAIQYVRIFNILPTTLKSTLQLKTNTHQISYQSSQSYNTLIINKLIQTTQSWHQTPHNNKMSQAFWLMKKVSNTKTIFTQKLHHFVLTSINNINHTCLSINLIIKDSKRITISKSLEKMSKSSKLLVNSPNY